MDRDGFSSFESFNNEPTPPKRKKKLSGPIKSLLFGFIGGVIAIVLFMFFIGSDLLNISTYDGHQKPLHQNEKNIQTKVNMSDNITDLSEVTKSVVGVINLQQRSLWDAGEMAGTGSGIVYKKTKKYAFIVTNNHVIERANEVEVELFDQKRIQAQVIGADALTDLAVLRVDAKDIEHIAEFGSSDDLTVGEDVVAIGNPLSLNFAGSVTRGIVSGLNRSVPIDTNGDQIPDWVNEVIQTDAAINPGNSGGALVNKAGEVIGINSMKIAQQEVEGIGFAIPIDTARPIIQELEETGEVERPFIGISMVDLTTVPKEQYDKVNIPKDLENGVIVAGVEPLSPADEAGVQQYDIITKINDHTVESYLDLRKYLYTDVKVGDELKIEFYRQNKKMNTTLKLTKLNP